MVEGIFSRLAELFFSHRVMNVDLSLMDVPDFCQAQITPEIVYPLIRRNQNKPQTAHIRISVDEDAPGFEPFNITVEAHAQPFKGPLGLLTIIKPSNDSVSIELTPGYYSNFWLDFIPFYEIPPLEQVTVPLNLTSLANADVFVQTEIIDPLENWTFNMTSNIIVPSGESEIFLLNVTPPDLHNEVEIIHILFNITVWEHPEVGYETIIVIITFRVKSRDGI
jgi:hypothetical protein